MTILFLRKQWYGTDKEVWDLEFSSKEQSSEITKLNFELLFYRIYDLLQNYFEFGPGDIAEASNLRDGKDKQNM